MSITATPISNIEIAKAFAVLENAGVITDDASCDLLSNWLADQGLTIESYSETLDSKHTFPEVAHPYNLSFTEEQLSNLYSCVEAQVRYGFDAVAEGMYQGAQDFASTFENLTDADGNAIAEGSPEWDQWVDAINEMILLNNFEVDGFDATAYYRRRLEARQLNGN